MSNSAKRAKIFVVFIALIAAIGYLIISGLEGTFVYSRTISEVRRLGKEVADQGLRIEGTVVQGSLQKSETTLHCTFALADSLGEFIEIRYDGILPDTFKEGMPAVAEGKYHADDYFVATNVLTKCPSKYEAAPEQTEATSSSATY
jgi:cytochrome c-type biogenesis protein CcmE